MALSTGNRRFNFFLKRSPSAGDLRAFLVFLTARVGYDVGKTHESIAFVVIKQ